MLPAGAFYALKNTPQGFSSSQNAVFAKETHAFRTDPNICWDLRVPIPAGVFSAPQQHPQVFSAAKMYGNCTETVWKCTEIVRKLYGNCTEMYDK